MEFSYRLTGVGWAEARLADEATVAVLDSVSYLTDTLSSLLFALGSLLAGAPDASCAWWLEPGAYLWRFRLEPEVQVALRILKSRNSFAPFDDAPGELVFECHGDLYEVAGAITRGIRAVLEDLGPDRYQEQWVLHPFPQALLELIEAEIAP